MRARQPLTARRLALSIAVLVLLLGATLILGASLGAGHATLWQWMPGADAPSAVDRTILFEVRVPRVLLAAIIGGALTVAGVMFQALLRNPLADPYVLGVSGGASIGGVTALLLGLGGGTSLVGRAAVPALAFAGALGALWLIQAVATVGGRMTVYTVLLTGAIFNAFSAAVIYLVQSLASLEQLHAIVFYLMGRVPSYDMATVGGLAVAVIVVCVAVWTLARGYNALSLGEEGAQHVGVDVESLKRRTLVAGSLLTALAVSMAGMIGFVGLVVPHVLRIVLGPDHRLLLPAAFFGGAAFLVLADLVSRLLIEPNELPVGVVTALIGGPFFLWLLRRGRVDHGF